MPAERLGDRDVRPEQRDRGQKRVTETRMHWNLLVCRVPAVANDEPAPSVTESRADDSRALRTVQHPGAGQAGDDRPAAGANAVQI